MFERGYRQRLDADLTRWQGDGIITPAAGAAIRAALPPLSPAVNIATVVGIVGGLLIAAAFLAFIAANWTAIVRPARFAILLAGIVGAYGIGAAMAHAERMAVAWNSVVARHLIAVAALTWWGVTEFNVAVHVTGSGAPATLAGGAALLLGAGLALASLRVETLRHLGLTLSTYGAFGLAFACAVTALIADPSNRPTFGAESWATSCGVVGVVLAFAGAAMVRRPGPAFAGLASGLTLFVVVGMARPVNGDEPWLAYALLLAAMLCLVISGMLDEVRPRVVAGWLGLAATMAAITWGVRGSLLRLSLI